MNFHGALPTTEPGRSSEEELVREFAVEKAAYYAAVFARIRGKTAYAWSFNPAAAVFGPVWAAARGVSILFWLAFFLQILAVVQIGVGLAGSLGAAEQARAVRLTERADARIAEAQSAEKAGAANAGGLRHTAEALDRAASAARKEAAAARAKGPLVVGSGIFTLLFGGFLVGFLGNPLLEKRFGRWRSARNLHKGRNYVLALAALIFCVAAYGLAVYRFVAATPPA